MCSKEYWIWLSLAFNSNASTVSDDVLQKFEGNPEKIYRATPEELRAKIIDDERLIRALSNKDLTPAKLILNKCEQHNIGILTPHSNFYPSVLFSITARPMVLYYKGSIPSNPLRLSVSIVGTRKPTQTGTNFAYTIAYDLAKQGVVIVSGMASGIDGTAHRGALDAMGTTIAVLGSGIDVVYPKENQQLYNDILLRGLIISEYPPGAKPLAWHFPQRNRIISGLSSATLVAEASEKSGSLITASHARAQGRLIYTVPGKGGEKACYGSNELIKNGAKIALSANDILHDFEKLYPDDIGPNSVNRYYTKPASPSAYPPSSNNQPNQNQFTPYQSNTNPMQYAPNPMYYGMPMQPMYPTANMYTPTYINGGQYVPPAMPNVVQPQQYFNAPHPQNNMYNAMPYNGMQPTDTIAAQYNGVSHENAQLYYTQNYDPYYQNQVATPSPQSAPHQEYNKQQQSEVNRDDSAAYMSFDVDHRLTSRQETAELLQKIRSTLPLIYPDQPLTDKGYETSRYWESPIPQSNNQKTAPPSPNGSNITPETEGKRAPSVAPKNKTSQATVARSANTTEKNKPKTKPTTEKEFKIPEGLSEPENKILNFLLQHGQSTTDEMTATGVPIGTIIGTLTLLEIADLIHPEPCGFYALGPAK